MIPVGDSPRTSRRPFVTWAIILVNVAVWVWVILLDDTVTGTRIQVVQGAREQAQLDCYGLQVAPTEREEAYCRWSLQPQEFFDNAAGELDYPVRSRGEIWFSILASMFMHAGWLHIAGNMLFLWVFGDNVEDRFGHLGFLLFWLASGIAAALTQAFIEPDSVVPIVGASGAVAGVLGAYIVFYPKATVNVVIPFFILIFIPIPIPAVIMIGLWFLQNLLAGFASVADETAVGGGVAFFAHIGGFLFGMLSVLLFFRGLGKKKRRIPPPPSWP
ncbi:MAG: rhomboid family intramembrane serine protease [Dehalococcoidia bacterium]|nr:rhomboid family intramembrane serine protease [Dehalococcoidia bacterium]